MKNFTAIALVTLISYVFFLYVFFLLGITCNENHHKEERQAITECEKDLPRSKNCKLIAVIEE